MLVAFYLTSNQTFRRFWANKTSTLYFTLAVLPFTQILIHFKKDKFNFEAAITKPALIARIHWDFSIRAVDALLPKHKETLFWFHEANDAYGRPNLWQLMTASNVGACTQVTSPHDKPSGRRAQPKPQYAGYLPIGWIVKVISYLIRLLRYLLCIRSWCTFFPQSHARRAKVNNSMEINGKKEEISGLPLACEQALCFGMGWKNREEREGKGESL